MYVCILDADVAIDVVVVDDDDGSEYWICVLHEKENDMHFVFVVQWKIRSNRRFFRKRSIISIKHHVDSRFIQIEKHSFVWKLRSEHLKTTKENVSIQKWLFVRWISFHFPTLHLTYYVLNEVQKFVRKFCSNYYKRSSLNDKKIAYFFILLNMHSSVVIMHF